MSSLRGTVVSSATTGSLSIAKPTGAVAGDLVVVFAIATGTGTNVATSLGTMTGWTATAQVADSSNTSFCCRGYAIVLTGSESWPFTITTGGANLNVSCAWTSCYTGITNFDPTTLTAPVVANTGTTLLATAKTLANAGDWVVGFWAGSKNGSTTAFTITVPTGYANTTDSGNIAGSTGSIRGSMADLETPQSSGAYTAPNATMSGTGVNFNWQTGIQLGSNISLAGVAATITDTAPVGSVNVAWAGPQSAVTVVAPAGTEAVTWAGAVAPINVTAPAGTLLNIQSLFGVPAVITTVARVGAFNVAWQGPAAAVTTSAPAGNLFGNSALLGPTAAVQMQAFAGGLNNVAPVYINPWYANQLDALDSDFEGPNVP